jgi:hypothetical protein
MDRLDRLTMIPAPPTWSMRLRLHVRHLFVRLDRRLDRVTSAVGREWACIVRRLHRSPDHVAQHRADLPGASPGACRPCALDLSHDPAGWRDAVTRIEVRHPQSQPVPDPRR